MQILKVGDCQKAACEDCKAFVTATFQLKDVPFSDGSGVAKNVLVGVCEGCDSVVLLPHQSTPAVKRQYEVQRKALESRVPAHMIDILNLVSYELSGSTEFVPNLVKFYLHSLSNNDICPLGIADYLQTDLAKGKAQKRISVKGRLVSEQVSQLKALTNIKSTTDLIKGIVLKINDDLLVNKNEQTIKQLKSIVAAMA
jgi:hypothetical protein